ncbi:MAG: hypothetical protein J7J01_01190 [Methanophagales archaeon]|nr:hypothetical protein [Methanophagales archaeon]
MRVRVMMCVGEITRERAPFQPTCSELVLKIKGDLHFVATDDGGSLEFFAKNLKRYDAPKITREDIVLASIDENYMRELLQRIVDHFNIEYVDNLGGGGHFDVVVWILYQYTLFRNGIIKEYKPLARRESKRFTELCSSLSVVSVSDEEREQILKQIYGDEEEED